jgi:hypothetical protein
MVDILEISKRIIEDKKIITPVIKTKLLELGYKEVVIGCHHEHEIKSKDIKLNFHGYDIVIGISCRSIGYASGRQYRALVYCFKKRKK